MDSKALAWLVTTFGFQQGLARSLLRRHGLTAEDVRDWTRFLDKARERPGITNAAAYTASLIRIYRNPRLAGKPWYVEQAERRGGGRGGEETKRARRQREEPCYLRPFDETPASPWGREEAKRTLEAEAARRPWLARALRRHDAAPRLDSGRGPGACGLCDTGESSGT